MNRTGATRVYTTGDRDLVIERTFDAPARLVFDAWTKPELLKRWFYGPDGWSLAVCEIDLRVGGKLRFVWRKEGEAEMGMSGVYREIAAPHRLVHTEVFDEAWYAGECIDTLELIETEGRTLAVATGTYESREIRDMVAASGAEAGMRASYERLAALLDDLASG
jgi:uncharacterized protein YndB with AHSA1/START domain